MKKISILFLLFVVLMYINNYDEYNITDDSIRFRVIANSNSTNDIIMKEKVVSEISNIIFIKKNNKEDVEKNIYDNLNNIEEIIKNLFKKNNYNMNFNIIYGYNKFPKKRYRGEELKEGIYKSLVIEIGEAKGNNYFCILYPSLCILDYKDSKDDEKYEYRFLNKIIKLINN